ncbi:MAG: 50S ribosomal protein L32 [Clostridia bacterium]|jgi:large subunit ribosomal protein L32|nr:50S ribosomal protein L32 [Clostridia bacterium]
MAVPKRKQSKARRDKRRSSTWKLALPTLTRCKKCGAMILAHRVCKKCGAYDGEVVIPQDTTPAN